MLRLTCKPLLGVHNDRLVCPLLGLCCLLCKRCRVTPKATLTARPNPAGGFAFGCAFWAKLGTIFDRILGTIFDPIKKHAKTRGALVNLAPTPPLLVTPHRGLFLKKTLTPAQSKFFFRKNLLRCRNKDQPKRKAENSSSP